MNRRVVVVYPMIYLISIKAGLPSAATPWLIPQNLPDTALVQRYRSFARLE